MKLHLATITLFLCACASKNSETSNTEKSFVDDTIKKHLNTDIVVFSDYKNDTIECINFWGKIVTPILQKDKIKVLGTIEFPLAGDWPGFIKLNKTDKEATESDFRKNYSKIFTVDFIDGLSKQTYKDIDITIQAGDTLFTIGVAKSDKDGLESSVILKYKKEKDFFKLILIQGVGGNFYE